MKTRLAVFIFLALAVLGSSSRVAYAGGIRKVWVSTKQDAKRPDFMVKPHDMIYITVEYDNAKKVDLKLKVYFPNGTLWKTFSFKPKDGTCESYKTVYPPKSGFDKGVWRVEAYDGEFKRASCTFTVRE